MKRIIHVFPKITSLMMICSLIDCHITLKTGMGLVVKVSYKVNVIRILIKLQLLILHCTWIRRALEDEFYSISLAPRCSQMDSAIHLIN